MSENSNNDELKEFLKGLVKKIKIKNMRNEMRSKIIKMRKDELDWMETQRYIDSLGRGA